MPPIITVTNLSKEYRTVKRHSGIGGSIRTLFTREYVTTQAVDDVNLTIQRGELIGYIGQNGAGKSTTFKMLTGVLLPTTGHIEVDGLIPFKQRQKLAYRIGSVFGQRSQLWWDLPLKESMEILKTIYRIPTEIYKQNLAEFDEILGLGELLEKPVRQLSLGQRMRSELAAAFLHNPEIAFLDEPLLGLDVVAKEHVRQFISESNRRRGITIVLASNDMADVERLCQRMLLIDKGHLLYDGTVDAIKHEYAPYRTLIVHTAETYTDAWVENAELVESEGTQLKFRFLRSINPQQLIANLSTRYEITDLLIEEPTLEDVIRGMYEETNKQRKEQGR
ncbi:ABC transporter ATP-binding protein [Dictyobacter formicarum]|uniref:ABC transporter ATP-binding protein n=1 Tax=Dictyobacter formicarum TaxID=2778368 RepID=A0ABQ3VG11_9CHLR|nr:ATP-binding cassette domain-containing protein [Dictyobacter formicarum]GHO84593.1 ABC transporter ATP-binding protein [Dictyobacter formicarum]